MSEEVFSKPVVLVDQCFRLIHLLRMYGLNDKKHMRVVIKSKSWCGKTITIAKKQPLKHLKILNINYVLPVKNYKLITNSLLYVEI
jgi:hypothetical protein